MTVRSRTVAVDLWLFLYYIRRDYAAGKYRVISSMPTVSHFA